MMEIGAEAVIACGRIVTTLMNVTITKHSHTTLIRTVWPGMYSPFRCNGI